MAKRRRDPAAGEDPFVQSMLRMWAWVEDNARAVIAGLVIVGLLVGGFLYWRGYQASVREQAASQLQDLQGRLLSGQVAPSAAESQMRTFIERYGGTEAADEARLLLARLYLRTNRPAEAVALLGQVEERSPETPIGYGAHNLLGKAHAAQGDHERALEVLGDIAEEARYPFQRTQARADRARILADMGRLGEAADIYASLVEEARDTQLRSLYAVRLGEIRARAETGGPEPPAGATDTAADTAAGSAFDTAAADTVAGAPGSSR